MPSNDVTTLCFNSCKKLNTIFKWQTKKYRLEMSAWYRIKNGFTFFRSQFMFKVQTINCMQYSEPVVIGHFRVPKTLSFKMRPSTQPFLWKWLLFAREWKIISISKAGHLTSFWYRDPMELGNGLFHNQTRSQSRNEINTQTERLVQKHNNLL